MKKISPSYRKLVNEVEPKLKNIHENLSSVEKMMNDASPEIIAVKSKMVEVELRMKKAGKRLEAFEEIVRKFFEKSGVLHRRIFYSQDGEDAVLASFYEEKPGYKGFYIDIGAYHPMRFSNTHYFYERGWRGINIDATPGSMDEFRRMRPRDKNIEIGISKERKKIIFYSFEEPALNSFDEKVSEERIEGGWKFRKKIAVKTAPVNEVLGENLPKGQHIDFMSIDIEGLDFEILKSLDWERYKPDFLLVEDLEIVDKGTIGYESSEMYKFLEGKNYSIIARTRRTLIFKKEKS
jgi:FkbM family methyltransferase